MKYGPALAISKNGGVKAKITFVPHQGETVNASRQVAYIAGEKHKVVFSSQIKHPNADHVIQIGGRLRLVSTLDAKKDEVARKIRLNNQSGFPVVLEQTAGDCVVQSIGPVRDGEKQDLVWLSAMGLIILLLGGGHIAMGIVQRNLRKKDTAFRVDQVDVL